MVWHQIADLTKLAAFSLERMQAFLSVVFLVTHPVRVRRMWVRFPPLRLLNRVRPTRPYKQSVSQTENVGSNPTMATLWPCSLTVKATDL